MAGLTRVSGVLAAAVFALLAVAWAAGEQTKPLSGIVDNANFLATPERTRIRLKLGEVAERLDTDLFLVTVDDTRAPWRDIATHRYMVAKALADLEATRKGVVPTHRTLTVLVAFKDNRIIHLDSDLKALDTALYLTRFYSGFEAAAFKVRNDDDTHGSALLRYLDELDEKTRGIAAVVDLNVFNRFWYGIEIFAKKVALRNIWPALDWLIGKGPDWVAAWVNASLWLVSQAALAGLVPVLVIGATVAVLASGLKLIVKLASKFTLGELGVRAAPWLGWIVLKPLKLVLFMPVIALAYAIGTYDVENMLFVSERFGLPLAVLLERAKDAHFYQIDVTLAHLVGGAALLLALDQITGRLQGPTRMKVRSSRWRIVTRTLVWVSRIVDRSGPWLAAAWTVFLTLALYALPGAAAAFGYAYFFAKRFIALVVALYELPSPAASPPITKLRKLA